MNKPKSLEMAILKFVQKHSSLQGATLLISDYASTSEEKQKYLNCQKKDIKNLASLVKRHLEKQHDFRVAKWCERKDSEV